MENIKNSNQFTINELVIVTKGGRIDISTIYAELNIFDSVFMPVMSGNILITDSLGLSGKLLFDGSESILIDISKFDSSDSVASFKKAFRIYKQSKRFNNTQNTESYILHFVSDELIFSDQNLINQSYENTYSEIIKNIMEDYLQVSKNNLEGIYSDSSGIKNIVIPNLSPLDAILWCTKRATDLKQSPNFMFFQNKTGYNFVSLSSLLPQSEILDIQFITKNLKNISKLDEISGAKAFEVVSSANLIERTRTGVNAGTFIGFDPITKTISSKKITYSDHYSSMDHGNDTPNVTDIKNRDGTQNQKTYNSRVSLSIFSTARQFSEYIKKNDPTSLSKEENQEDFLFQRKAIINNLMSKRIKVVMPGNFDLSSGFNVNFQVPIFGEKEKNETPDDKSLNGKYMIIASRHIIGYEKHETIIEIATTSTTVGKILESSVDEVQEIMEY
jgi:hypothetical protein